MFDVQRPALTDVVRAWVSDRPTEIALVCGDIERTWSELDERIRHLAGALESSGVQPGDRIGILDRNGLAQLELLFAAASIGAVLVPLNWRLAPGELAYVIDDAAVRLLFVGAPFAELATDAISQLAVARPDVIGLDGDGDGQQYEDWVGDATPRSAEPAGGGDEVVLQLYTSGTTGHPKGVMLSHANLAVSITSALEMFGFDDRAVCLDPMPMFHIGGIGWALAGLASGGTSIVLRDLDPVAVVNLCADRRVTHTFLVPAFIGAMLAMPGIAERDFGSLRCLCYGGSAITDAILDAALQVFPDALHQVYGMTETCGTLTVLSPDDHVDPAHPERRRSAGRPAIGIEVRIVDPSSAADVASGTVGEIWTRGAQVMRGYWGDDAATAQTLLDDGWLRTGDAGRVDEHGLLYIHDRVKDMIVSGGENIYPAEVESVLASHEAVADVAVIGVPDDRWGEAVKAVVVTVPGTEVPEAELIQFARLHMAHYKCPASVEFVDVLPRNATGKVLKRELREPFWAGRDRRVN